MQDILRGKPQNNDGNCVQKEGGITNVEFVSRKVLVTQIVYLHTKHDPRVSRATAFDRRMPV